MKTTLLAAAVLSTLLAADDADPSPKDPSSKDTAPNVTAPKFTTARARDAWKAYEKALEKAKAEYDAKVGKARADCAKALEGALPAAKKSKSGDAKAIEKALEELKAKGAGASGGPGASGGAGKGAAGGSGKVERGPDGVTFTGGSGESLEDAIKINGAEDSPGAVDAEGHWLRKHYPKLKKIGQGLVARDGKHYDSIELVGPDGAKKTVWFDISDCFGFPKE